jgi:hypothetical protein
MAGRLDRAALVVRLLLGATIEHVEPFLEGRDLLHASMTCRSLHEVVTGDERLRATMLQSARVATFHCSSDANMCSALCERDWGIDPVDFASATVQLLSRCYRMERGALWLLHVSFEAVVMRILLAAHGLLDTAKRPESYPHAEETDYPYSVRVTLADLNGGLRLCLWGGGPFLDKTDVGPEELRRFPELDRGILRLARMSGVLEFDPCLFAFVGALLGRYVRWVVAKVKGAAGEMEDAHEEGPTPVERVNRVLGAVHRMMGSSRLLEAIESPATLEVACALEPVAFEQIVVKLQPDAYFGTDFRAVPSFGHLSYLHAALNREVEDVLAFVAAATRDVTDADASCGVSCGFERRLAALFAHLSPWPCAVRSYCRPADVDPPRNPLIASLGLAIRRAGIREWLVEDVLLYVSRLVVVYIKAMLMYWEATETEEEADEDAGGWDDDMEASDDDDDDDEADDDDKEDDEEEMEEDVAGGFREQQLSASNLTDLLLQRMAARRMQ